VAAFDIDAGRPTPKQANSHNRPVQKMHRPEKKQTLYFSISKFYA
jgi:hypothetical protein